MEKERKRPKIEIGYRCGNLIVESRTEERKSGYAVWACRCDCGSEIRLDTRYLQRGTVTDCGCQKKMKPRQKDLTGQRFGKLVCIEHMEKRSESLGSVMWRCQCDCGNECQVSSSQLVSGNKKSCGCLGHPPLKDYIGRRFGQLTVVEYGGKKAGMHRWLCQCDCGNETLVGQTLLQTGKTKSCGCRKASAMVTNLKLCEGTSITKLEASKKRKVSSNTSGHTGVYKNKKTNKWVAQITFKKKTYYLGSFDEIEDAVMARKKGEEMHEDFLNWYYQEQNRTQETEYDRQKTKKVKPGRASGASVGANPGIGAAQVRIGGNQAAACR